VAAGAVLVAGDLNAQRLGHREAKLQAACEAQLAKAKADQPKDDDSPLDGLPDPPCDAHSLLADNIGWNGLRGEILDAHAAAAASRSWSKLAAPTIAVLGALPWTWYFLLRRVAELRAAIGGQPPSG
jgi:hypothetical protein